MITFKELGKHGQLGNQLFQIASTIGIACSNKQNYIFPRWCYSDYFENPIPQTDDKMDGFRTYSETSKEEFHCIPLILDGNWSLYGYFQSVGYFNQYEQLIRYYFEPKNGVKDKLLSKYRDVLPNSCAIHIRRAGKGDSVTRDAFWVPLKYYQMAMNLLPKIQNFLIFSNDINWCEKHFKGKNFVFVKHQSNIEDLFLMSMCKHNITGNSTFSWWAAWLNKNPLKKVVAPNPWLGWTRGDLDMGSLVLTDWKKIDITDMVFTPSAKAANNLIKIGLPLLPRFIRFMFRKELLKRQSQ
jgi:hypothetical protein